MFTDPPPTSQTTVQKKKTQHVTRDMWLEVKIVSKLQLPSSNGLEVVIFEDLEEKDH